ncbi:ComEC/Rec2 family competence protein [Tepidibacter formicigenes]|jgi:competence protein ComEC|uniref:Competence protein ComEC n=1 Tax=Tepidibacter formicigenes DSM 15518 TaxID=1123349 RepID=A0A1M6LXW8_9FIRM|nr:ComEC/Rec2 family competence protein [Tepidibacter formicigenes]SHJ76000.1 competence protein ComEC [Tepidibacter formicigenes DSM 15518]
MRRPIFIIFITSLLFAFIYTKNYEDNFYKLDNNEIQLKGIVKKANYEEKYFEYKIGEFLVRDFNKKHKIPVGYYVCINGKLKSLEDLKLNEFDYGRYLRSIGYIGIINLRNYKVENKNKNIYYFSYKGKCFIENRLENIFRNQAPFLKALVLGDKEDIEKEILDSFSKTGTSHIIALSGLHVGIIIYIFNFIIRGINKFYKLMIMVVSLFFYCFIVGFTPSVVRACVFSIIMYLALFIQREYDGICSLSFVGIVLIIENPFVIYSISFQLSFFATLSIIYFYSIINKYISYPLISITIAANILTLPIIYFNFKIIPIMVLVANILIVPFIGVLISLVLISLIMSFLNLKITFIFIKTVIFIQDYIFLLINYLSNIKFSYIELKNVNLKLVILYYILLMSYMLFRETKIVKEQKNEVQGYY